MPTYNHARYIADAVDSVRAQTYPKWELIIIDDGSTDDTASVLARYRHDSRIRYIHQSNADQLNALINGAAHITGDIVSIIHSDDQLAHENAFRNIAQTFRTDARIDGVTADYIIIDKDGRVMHRDCRGINSEKVDALLTQILYLRGANLVGDHFVVRREIFERHIVPNYLYDNTIYYIDYDRLRILTLRTIDPWYRYRVFEGNYVQSDIGKYVHFNGSIRTTYRLLSAGLSLTPSSLVFGYGNALVNRLGLSGLIRLRREPRINVTFATRYYTSWLDDMIANHYPEILLRQLRKILHSLACINVTDFKRPLRISPAMSVNKYRGKDSRLFYYDYQRNDIGEPYKSLLFEEFDGIIVSSDEDARAIADAMQYLSLFYAIKREP